VLSQFFVKYIVEVQFFFVGATMDANQFLGDVVVEKTGFQSKTIFSKTNVERIRIIEITFGETTIINGV
jgi:hypothetical protein